MTGQTIIGEWHWNRLSKGKWYEADYDGETGALLGEFKNITRESEAVFAHPNGSIYEFNLENGTWQSIEASTIAINYIISTEHNDHPISEADSTIPSEEAYEWTTEPDDKFNLRNGTWQSIEASTSPLNDTISTEQNDQPVSEADSTMQSEEANEWTTEPDAVLLREANYLTPSHVNETITTEIQTISTKRQTIMNKAETITTKIRTAASSATRNGTLKHNMHHSHLVSSLSRISFDYLSLLTSIILSKFL